MWSNYEHYDCNNNTYYSLFDECYKWENVFNKNRISECFDWDLKQFYARNTVDDNGYLQLAYVFNDDGHYVLCVYKHYELLATYEEGCMEDIEDLAVYDYRLDDDDLYTYKELFESLGNQYREHCEIMYTDEMLRKKLNCKEKRSRSFYLTFIRLSVTHVAFSRARSKYSFLLTTFKIRVTKTFDKNIKAIAITRFMND